MFRNPSTLLSLSFLLALLPSPVAADDGVVEINQAAVSAGGITPSDSPGFPATLDRRGSYRLTGNLSVPASTDGVRIEADGVTLDLNGFSISGPTRITCPIQGCPPNNGIGVHSLNATGSTVRNGSVENMGAEGIRLDGEARVYDVTARSNGRSGIQVGSWSLVRHCVANQNDLAGIIAPDSSTVIGNTMVGNGVQGLRCPTGNGRTCGYAFNVLALNSNHSTDPAAQVLHGNQTGGNVCGTGLCP